MFDKLRRRGIGASLAFIMVFQIRIPLYEYHQITRFYIIIKNIFTLSNIMIDLEDRS